MEPDESGRLAELLIETHESIGSVVDAVDLEIEVHADSAWQIRDVLGHIGTWDRVVARTLRAYRDGGEYVIPDYDEDAFNARDVLRQRELTSEQIYDEWKLAREEFVAAVRQIPPEFFPGDLVYPWGDESGTVAYLIETMAEHDVEHRDEIALAIGSGRR
ncbi:DinB family protein [bacterium]|nr:DinB family protein [bacterium]